MSRIYPLMLLCSALQPTLAQEPHVRYIQNKGQWPEQVRFKTDLSEAAMFLENDGLTWVRYEPGAADRVHDLNHHPELEQDFSLKGHAWKVRFVGANANATITTEEKQSYYLNYFIGNDPAKWAGFVPVFQGVTYHDLWPSIDLRWHGAKAQIKYDLMVNAGADPSTIGFEYEGLDGISIDENGDLVLKTSVGEMKEMKPVAWYADTRQPIACAYRVSDGRVGFSFPAGIDPDRDVVIDPLLYGATLSGSVDYSTYGFCATYDETGNMYGAGGSLGPGFPTTAGAFEEDYTGFGASDIVINKFSDATSLLWATYIGTTGDEIPHSIITNALGEVSILGTSSTANYPTTPGCVQAVFGGGGNDIVVTRLNATGSALIGSTYLGGSGQDGAQVGMLDIFSDKYRGEIQLDSLGNMWIGHCTTSSNFPVSINAFQDTLGGSHDGLIACLSSDCTSLLYSTYFGGSSLDVIRGIRLYQDRVYACGASASYDLPMAGGGYQNSYQGGTKDAFVLEFSNGGTSLSASSYLGTPGKDASYLLDLDQNGKVVLVGISDTGFVIAPAGIYGQYWGRTFVAKFDSALSNVLFITMLGNNDTTASGFTPAAFGLDECDRVHVSGYFAYDNWHCTSDALYATPGVNGAFYIAAFEADMTSILFGSYYGGNHVDGGMSRFNTSGVLYEAICSQNGVAPMQTTPGAFAPANDAVFDLGLLKVDFVVDSCDFTTGSQDPETSGHGLTLMPVPTTDMLALSGALPGRSPWSVEVFDSEGRMVFTRELPVQRAMNITWLASGIYSIRVSDRSGAATVGRFVKE